MTSTKKSIPTQTNIHFRQEGEHKIMAIAGMYEQEDVKEILHENDIMIDDDRVLLTYQQFETKGKSDD